MVRYVDFKMKITQLETKTQKLHDLLQESMAENENLKLNVEITSKKQKEIIKMVQKSGSERGNSSHSRMGK